MNKITKSHLSRTAYVYVRQSTRDQVENHIESQRRQYALKDKALELGCRKVVVIDGDQAKTSDGSVTRADFEYLLAQVCKGEAGTIFVVEASRLARNGREWHTLLELCGLTDVLIIDHDGTYDPKHPNDRLLLGMKGILSEMELNILLQRSQEALKQKAKRGELFITVAVGYVRVSDTRIEKDPDLRVQEAMSLVFKKFEELGSVRQTLIWFRQEQVKLPAVIYAKGESGSVWKFPQYNSLLNILTNPIYAGAYTYGRTYTKTTIENGKKRKRRGIRREPDDWLVLIKDHHEGYISWDEYQHFQNTIAHNANMKGPAVRGSVRGGEGLLAGLLRCGHCGRKLYVLRGGSYGRNVRYLCRGAQKTYGVDKCIGFGALKVDKAVGETILQVLSPLGVEAAVEAVHRIEEKESEARRQKELALEQASYEAQRAKKQYDLADPENRLVTGELERRWEVCLSKVQDLEDELSKIPENTMSLSEEEKKEILSLGENLRNVWYHEKSSIQLKKRIVRTIIKEIVVWLEEDIIKLILHWEGGDHCELKVRKTKVGHHRWKTDGETQKIVEQLARVTPDNEIARILNRLGRKTGKGNAWSQARVTSFRSTHNIPVYKEGELELRGEVLVDRVATRLSVSREKVYRLIHKKILKASQACFGAPWVIRETDITEGVVHRSRQQKIKSGPSTQDQPELFPHIATT